MADRLETERDTGTGPGQSRGLALLGILLGVGLGGFVDGIVLHQILQWHHMTVADIAFLVFGAALIVVGWLLQRSGRPMAVHAEGA